MLERAQRIGLTVQQMGENSEGVVVPAEWRDDLDIDAGDLVDAELDRDEGTVTYHF